MTTHSSILVWRIPWMEEPGGLKSMGSQRVSNRVFLKASFTFSFLKSFFTRVTFLADKLVTDIILFNLY